MFHQITYVESRCKPISCNTVQPIFPYFTQISRPRPSPSSARCTGRRNRRNDGRARTRATALVQAKNSGSQKCLRINELEAFAMFVVHQCCGLPADLFGLSRGILSCSPSGNILVGAGIAEFYAQKARIISDLHRAVFVKPHFSRKFQNFFVRVQQPGGMTTTVQLPGLPCRLPRIQN